MEGILAVAAIAFVAFVCVFAYLRHRDRPEQRAKRALAAQRPTPIRAAPEGVLVKIAGRATPVGETLAGPLSGRPCVFHQIRVRQASGDVEIELALDPVETDFLVDDGTGIARIRVRDVEVSLAEDFFTGLRDKDDLAAARAAILSRLGIPDERGTSCAEAIVAPGAPVSILGVARRPGPGEEAGPRKVDLVFESPPDAPLRLGRG